MYAIRTAPLRDAELAAASGRESDPPSGAAAGFFTF